MYRGIPVGQGFRSRILSGRSHRETGGGDDRRRSGEFALGQRRRFDPKRFAK